MRFRFSLRWMLVVPVAVAIFVASEQKRANNQSDLATKLIEIDGSFQRTHRRFLPAKICDMLPPEYGMTITDVTLGGAALPMSTAMTRGTAMSGIRVVTSATLSDFADMPAMKKIKSCSLVGTSVDDGVADKFAALPNCKKVSVVYSAVTKSEYYPVIGRRAFGPLTGKGRPITIGDPSLSYFHRGALELTNDLQIFARALEHEDVEAIRDVLRLSKKGNERVLIETLAELQSPERLAAAAEAIQDNRSNASSIAANALELIGERIVNNVGLLRSLSDKRPYVRQVAVRNITTTRREKLLDFDQLTEKMADISMDPEPNIRWMIIDWLPEALDDYHYETILHALSDSDSMVRAAAARGLGKLNDPRAIPHLQKSVNDHDSFVKRHSLESIEILAEDRGP